jgi:mannose-6-phosphate isomerase-like protein (cupin superfamily)
MIVDKPWGKVATYALNQPSSVRMITVEPAQETSVHYHRMRDEMWVVLDPGLTVEIGNRVVEAQAGEEFMVAAEETHRIRNVGTIRGRVLENVVSRTGSTGACFSKEVMRGLARSEDQRPDQVSTGSSRGGRR